MPTTIARPVRPITQGLKDRLVHRAKEHRAADRLIQGEYFEGYNGDAKGCAIGCLSTPLGVVRQKRRFDKSQAQCIRDLKNEFGLCSELVRVAEIVFEAFDIDDRSGWRNWPTRFAEALPVGVEITNSMVRAFVQNSTEFRYDYDYFTGGRSTLSWVVEARPAASELLRWLRKLGRS